MRMSASFALACLIPLIVACSSEPEPEGVLTKTQEQGMERAGEVENVLQKSAEQRREESEAY